VYDITGREMVTLVNEKQSPNTYEVTFDAINLPAGIYYYAFDVGEFSSERKMWSKV